MKRFLHHLFLPHESNNHRAKLLHHSSLLILVIGIVGISYLFSIPPSRNQNVLGISYSITVDDLLATTNAKRQENGLSPLTLDSSLSQAAAQKAADMFAKNYWAHIAPDGTTPWYFIRNSGYEYVYAGENLARGFITTSDVVNAWMASPSHRENMLSANYKDVGFSIMDGNLTGDDTVLVVEEFGSKLASGSTGSSQAQPAKPEVQAQTLVPITPLPTGSITIPTPTSPVVTTEPTSTPLVAQLPLRQTQVEAFRNDPLINKPAAQKNIALFIVGGILLLLCLDLVIIRRKKVTRILSHNLDHIIFFGMLLLLLLLLTKGGIL